MNAMDRAAANSKDEKNCDSYAKKMANAGAKPKAKSSPTRTSPGETRAWSEVFNSNNDKYKAKKREMIWISIVWKSMSWMNS